MLTFRKATVNDIDLFFNWANDAVARNNSYQKHEISYEDHVKWFYSQIANEKNYFYIFLNESNVPVGQVRINIKDQNQAIVGVVIDPEFRGLGYAQQMIENASQHFLDHNQHYQILAYIFKENLQSYKGFKKAGYELLREEVVNNIPSFILYKINNEKRY